MCEQIDAANLVWPEWDPGRPGEVVVVELGEEMTKEEQEAADDFVKKFEQQLAEAGVIEVIVPTGNIKEEPYVNSERTRGQRSL